jgi:hypothetical protein
MRAGFSPLLTHELVAFGALLVDRLLRAGEKRFAGKGADGSTFQLPNLSTLVTCWTSHGFDLAADVFDLYELPFDALEQNKNTRSRGAQK